MSACGSVIIGLMGVLTHIQHDPSLGNVIIYAAIFLQTATLTNYSFGPQKNKKKFLLRYIALRLCLALAVLVYGLRYTRLFLFYNKPMFIDGVYDLVKDTGAGGFFYNCFIAILGFAEPIRVGWDARELIEKEAENR